MQKSHQKKKNPTYSQFRTQPTTGDWGDPANHHRQDGKEAV